MPQRLPSMPTAGSEPEDTEYVWTPARLTAWLQEFQAASSSSCSCETADQESQQLVPQHLRQLLILLLQAAADTGHAHDLIWTPSRFDDWLATGDARQPHAGHSGCNSSSNSHGSDVAVAAGWADVCRAARVSAAWTNNNKLQPCVELLPLVKSVAASQAQAAQSAAVGAADGSSPEQSSQSFITRLTDREAAVLSRNSYQVAISCVEQERSQSAGTEEQDSYCVHNKLPQPQLQMYSRAAEQRVQLPGSTGQQQQQQQEAPETSVQPRQHVHQAVTASGGADTPPVPFASGADVSSQPSLQDDTGPQQQSQPQLLPLLQQLQQLHRATSNQRQLRHVVTQQAPARPLPGKEALPGDYEAVHLNPAWSPSGLHEAAAAAALKLGLPPALSGLPAGQASCSSVVETEPSAATNNDSCSTGSLPAVGDGDQQARQTATPQTPRFGVLMLVHEKGVTAAEVWEAWEALHAGRAVVRVHLKQGVSTAGLPGEAWVNCRQLPSRICSQWGCISLTGAILQAAADMLQQHPHLQHVALVSGQDVPVSAVPRDLRPGMSLFGRFQFGRAFDDAARRVAGELLSKRLDMSAEEGSAWGNALVFHHTWMVLDRQLVLALISKQEELLRVGAVLNERFMEPDVAVAADEFILVTAAMRYGFIKQVVHKKLQPYMVALRRQHRQQQSAGTAGEDGRTMQGGERPAKQQRLGGHVQGGVRGGRQQAQSMGQGHSSRSSSINSTRGGRGDVATGSDRAATSSGGSRSSSRGRVPLDPRPLSAPAAAAAAAAGARSTGANRAAQDSAVSTSGSEAKARTGAATRSTVLSVHDVTKQACSSTTCSLAADAAAPAPGSPLYDGTHGVLLDCCPTLALFHPTQTRHPHEWRNFTECLLVDVNSSRPGNHKLMLLEALALAQPNAALFFRKVEQMQRQGPAQLMGCLKLLWKNKSLPPTVEELPP